MELGNILIDDVDLDIKRNDDWNDTHWRMQIHLRAFLNDMKLSSFRILLKYIRESDTPEEEQKILNYVQEYIGGCADELQILEKHKIGQEQKVKYAKSAYDDSVKDRQQFGRNTKNYKTASKSVKRAKEEWNIMKSRLFSIRYEICVLERSREFMLKCLKELQ